MQTSRFPVVRLCASVAAALLLSLPSARSAEVTRIGGTGIGLALARIVGDALAARQPDIRTEVLPSLGTPGGIRALLAGAVDIAIAARDLTLDEKSKGVQPAFCMKTALVFASSHPQPAGIQLAQLPRIYSDPDPRWPDGAALKIILRSRDGSENPYLIKLVPGMDAAFDAAYRRPGIPIGATDQENAAVARATAGSLAIMTLLQLRSENLPLRPLAIDGVEPSAQTLASGAYPMPLPLCLLLPQNPARAAAQYISFVRSPEGRDLVRRYGADPLN